MVEWAHVSIRTRIPNPTDIIGLFIKAIRVQKSKKEYYEWIRNFNIKIEPPKSRVPITDQNNAEQPPSHSKHRNAFRK